MIKIPREKRDGQRYRKGEREKRKSREKEKAWQGKDRRKTFARDKILIVVPYLIRIKIGQR